MTRADDDRHFTPEDEAVVGALSPYLAETLRRALLLESRSGSRGEDEICVVTLAADNSVVTSNGAADRWLDELRPVYLPPVVVAVAARARTVADGRGGAVARARVRTASGRWLLVRGTRLGDAAATVAVILEPLRPHELAPLIADPYGLTDRERAVTELVAQGLDTQTMSERLHISSWTVQDHLKAIFEKLQVSSRGELTARLFFEHYAPRLTD